eukprot:CAMPEP_0176501538 /NCGR_PEP_ID=MMETSP0200_2-20121128/14213_1 /TAXON_ID=947934 /ORGANISM="Chaetoceros sp., Strain GSL56" /LENGTH=2268 /DNA_ID=CAMNT_0017900429 /DNA_START=305 /DNA_END=7111 /DNA_ORIENTATION=+
MFSSITKSIVSLTGGGPRAIIASQIARVLGEYFVVNPDDIESSLLRDAKIVLRDTQIRKKEYLDTTGSTPDTIVTVSGIVEEVIFSWKWSFSSSSGGSASLSSSRGTGMVQDAALSIKGLKVMVEFDKRTSSEGVYDNDTMNMSTPGAKSESTKMNDGNPQKEGFLQNYIQQIVDHLTVKVDDFEISFQAQGGPSMVVYGKDLALVTLASAKVPSDGSVTRKTILSQAISIGLFAIIVRDDEEEYSLIEPFGYTASVTRLFGKRFQHGIFSGLDVSGLPKDEDKMKINIGPPQIRVLCALAMYLTPTKSFVMEKDDMLMEQGECSMSSLDSNARDYSTMFTLPLPEVTLLISQDITRSSWEPTEISIPSVVISFRSDGAIFRIEGCGDIDCDGRRTVGVINGAFWNLDLVKQTFIIKQKVGKRMDDVAFDESCLLTIAVNEESLRPLVSNVKSVVNNHDIENLMIAFDRKDTEIKSLKDTNQASKPWIISVDGSIQLIAESSCGGTRDVESINLTVRSIRAVAALDGSKASYILNEVDCGGLEMTSNIDKDALLVVPTFRVVDNTLSLNGVLKLSIHSAEKARGIQSFALRFKDSFADKTIVDDDTNHPVHALLPFDVIMTDAQFSLSEGSGLNLTMHGIQTKNGILSIQSLEVSGNESLHFESSNLTATLDTLSPLNISLGVVSRLSVPDLFYLSSPVKNTFISFSNKCISVKLPKAYACVNLQDGGQSTNPTPGDHSQYLPDMKVELSVEKIVLELEHQHPSYQKCGEVQLSDLMIGVCMHGTDLALLSNRKIDFLITNAQKEWIQGSMCPFQATANMENPSIISSFVSDEGLSISSSSFGKMEASITSLNLPQVNNNSLILPELVLGQIVIKVETFSLLERLQATMWTIAGGRKLDTPSEKKASYDLPLSVRISDVNFCVIDQVDTISIKCCRAEKTCITCTALSLKRGNEHKCILKDVEIFLNPSINVKIGMIEDVLIKGSVSLLEAIPEVSITMKDDALKVAIDEVQVKVLSVADTGGFGEGPGEEEHAVNANAFEFPYSLGIDVLNLKLFTDDDATSTVDISEISINMSVEAGIVSMDTYGITTMTFHHDDSWIKLSLLPSLFSAVADTFLLNSMCLGGLMIGLSSFGYVEVTIPTFTSLPESRQIVSESTITVTLESYEVLQKVYHFALQILQKLNSMNASSDSRNVPADESYWCTVLVKVPSLELRIQEPSLSILKVKDVYLSVNRLGLKSLAYHEEGASVMELEEISIAFEGADVIASIMKVSHIITPKVLMQTDFDLNSVKCNIPLVDWNEGLTNQKSSNEMIFCLPISIQIQMKCFRMESLIKNSGISIEHIKMSLESEGSKLLIQTAREMKLKLNHSTEDWLEAGLKNLTAIVELENGEFDIRGFEGSGIDIGPSSPSCGFLCANVPPFNHDGEGFSINDFIDVSIHSIDTASNTLSLVQNVSSLIFTSSSSLELPFPITLHGFQISFGQPKSDLVLYNVKGSYNNILCCKFDANIEKIASVSAESISVNLQVLELEVKRINSFTVSHVFSLSKPLLGCKLTCSSSYLISLPGEVHVNMLSRLEQNSLSSEEYQVDSNSSGYEIPVPFQIHLNQLIVSNIGRDMNLCVYDLKLSAAPSSSGPKGLMQGQPQRTQVTDFTLTVGNASCELFELGSMQMSFFIPSQDFATLRTLRIALESVKVTAGFSNVDWACFLTNKNGNSQNATELSIFNTPFAKIDPFQLSVSYKGKILSTRSNIKVPAFSGNAITTSQTIIQYYTDVVLKRIPGFLTNVEFLGENVIDSSLKNTCMAVGAATTKSLSGAGLGSVAGVVVADAIRAGIDSGKKSRNVDTSDGYKFGDFTRGIVHGVRENAKTGANMRGDPGTYVPGDLIAGSSMAAGGYVKNNKEKLSAAGGAGIGATVGMVVAGPLGFIAGSYLGGKAVQNVVVGDKQAQSKTKDASQVKPPQAKLCTQIRVLKQGTLTPEVHYQHPSFSQSSSSATQVFHNQHKFVSESNTSIQIHSSSHSNAQVDFFSGSPHTKNQELPTSEREPPFKSGFEFLNDPSCAGQNAYQITDLRAGIDIQRNGVTESSQTSLNATKTNSGVLHSRDPFDIFAADISSQHTPQSSSGHKDTPSNITQYPSGYNYHHTAGQSISTPQTNTGVFSGAIYRVNTLNPRTPDASTSSDYDIFNDMPLSQQNSSYAQPGASPGQSQYQTVHGTQKTTKKTTNAPQNNSTKKDGYKFGDFTKSIVAKGKKSDGRKEDSSYKFGDFTRGLFG